MEDFFCEEKRYVGGTYIGLPVEIRGLPETIDIDGASLLRKSSFHVSFVHSEGLISKYGEQMPNLEEKITGAFCQFVSNHEISLLRYRNEFRFAEKDERKTLVVMCDVSNLIELFSYLNSILGTDVEVQPTHITLYSLRPNEGIGLPTHADIKTRTRVVTEKVPVEVKRSLGLV